MIIYYDSTLFLLLSLAILSVLSLLLFQTELLHIVCIHTLYIHMICYICIYKYMMYIYIHIHTYLSRIHVLYIHIHCAKYKIQYVTWYVIIRCVFIYICTYTSCFLCKEYIYILYIMIKDHKSTLFLGSPGPMVVTQAHFTLKHCVSLTTWTKSNCVCMSY
jgi:hypothetical protein